MQISSMHTRSGYSGQPFQPASPGTLYVTPLSPFIEGPRGDKLLEVLRAADPQATAVLVDGEELHIGIPNGASFRAATTVLSARHISCHWDWVEGDDRVVATGVSIFGHLDLWQRASPCGGPILETYHDLWPYLLVRTGQLILEAYERRLSPMRGDEESPHWLPLYKLLVSTAAGSELLEDGNGSLYRGSPAVREFIQGLLHSSDIWARLSDRDLLIPFGGVDPCRDVDGSTAPPEQTSVKPRPPFYVPDVDALKPEDLVKWVHVLEKRIAAVRACLESLEARTTGKEP